MNYFVYWTKLDRSDRKTIIFKSVEELSNILKAENKNLHEAWRLDISIKVDKDKQNYFYAFPSKISGRSGLEWYNNLNSSSKSPKRIYWIFEEVEENPLTNLGS